MKAPPGWDGILDDDERILWQGRPDPAFHVKLGNIPVVLFGLAFAGFALFWMVMAARAGGVFWMFGLIHFSVGLGIVFGATFWDTVKRRFTWYTLTDRRAFIATDLPVRGKSLKGFTIDEDTVLDYRAGDPATIFFAKEARRGNRGRRYLAPVGFERIGEGEKVLRLLREVQKADGRDRQQGA